MHMEVDLSLYQRIPVISCQYAEDSRPEPCNNANRSRRELGIGHERPIFGHFGPLKHAWLRWPRINPSAIGLALALVVSEVYVSIRGDDRVLALLILYGAQTLALG
jgi:hypothetical protein